MLRNLGLAVIAMLGTLVVVELALRWFLPPRNDGWASIPPIEERIRDLPPRAPDEVRWLAVGDSQTEFMDDVEGNWFREAVRRARADGLAVRGINLAQKGTGLAHYEQNLRDYGEVIAPELVLVGLYLGNDVLDYELAARMESQGLGRLSVVTRGRRSLRLGDQPRSLRLVGLVTAFWRRWIPNAARFDRDLQNMASVFGLSDAEVDAALARIAPDVLRQARYEEINPWDVVAGALFPDRTRDLVLLSPGSPSAEAFEAFLDGILRLDTTCRTVAPTCVYVVLPVAPQVDARYHDSFTRVGHVVSPAVVGDATPLMHRLRRFFDDRRLHAVFPLRDLLKATDDVYVPLDAHLNFAGQTIAGAAVYQALRPHERAGRGPSAVPSPGRRGRP